jgi:hypothetical protein
MNLQANPEAQRSLQRLVQCSLLKEPEVAAATALAADARLADCVAQAETVHLHIKVEDTDALPVRAFTEAGALFDHGTRGFVKYRFPGGVNVIFSHIQVSADDLRETQADRRTRPFLDHIGIDLRRTDDASRRAFDTLPAMASERGWAHAAQGGEGKAVYCCHVEVQAKHWLFPAGNTCAPGIPLEFAFGPLKVNPEKSGCDLRPSDPRKAGAVAAPCCAKPLVQIE